MEDNPYSRLAEELKRMGEAGRRPAFRTGVVTSLAPLMVASGGLTLTGEDLLVNPDLLPRKERLRLTLLQGTLAGTCTGRPGETVTLTPAEAELTVEAERPGSLSLGCRVALLTSDGDDLFILLCKVVSLP